MSLETGRSRSKRPDCVLRALSRTCGGIPRQSSRSSSRLGGLLSRGSLLRSQHGSPTSFELGSRFRRPITTRRDPFRPPLTRLAVNGSRRWKRSGCFRRAVSGDGGSGRIARGARGPPDAAALLAAAPLARRSRRRARAAPALSARLRTGPPQRRPGAATHNRVTPVNAYIYIC